MIRFKIWLLELGLRLSDRQMRYARELIEDEFIDQSELNDAIGMRNRLLRRLKKAREKLKSN